ncbi:hypothetical protein KM043_010328 [Ampulex compressa]|nr:hypothetical protein KM043_010328 [Ampulex compressa]
MAQQVSSSSLIILQDASQKMGLSLDNMGPKVDQRKHRLFQLALWLHTFEPDRMVQVDSSSVNRRPKIQMWPAIALASAGIILLLHTTAARHHHRSGNGHKPSGDISLWIDQQQIKMFSGLEMEIFAITEGKVLSYLLDPEFENKLPIIPSEVSYVNFTWKSGVKKYYYNFYQLKSFDESILKTPSITIKTHGRVPKRPKEFSVLLPCSGNNSGIAQFDIGLVIQTRKGKPLSGTPLRLKLRKECTVREPNPGPCPDGYLGPPHCKKALCYPNCMNGGNCTAPGVCSCPPGFQGPYCEGGIVNKNKV